MRAFYFRAEHCNDCTDSSVRILVRDVLFALFAYKLFNFYIMSNHIHTTWGKDFSHESLGSLMGFVDADIVVIGGGMAGMLAAYTLSESGKKIVLIEKSKIGSGATVATSAMLTQIIDTDYKDIINYQGKEMAEQIAASHRFAIDSIEKIIMQEGIECEWKRVPNYIYAQNSNDAEDLKKEADAQAESGIPSEWKDEAEIDIGIRACGAIEVSHQAKFNPGKFISGLARVLRDRGVLIFENTNAIAMEDKGQKKVITTTNGHSESHITSNWVIVTTYEPFMRPLRLYFKKAFYTSYVYELEFPHQSLVEGIYEDNANPYHYFRVDRLEDRDRVIIGGEDHRSDLHVSEEKCFKALMKYTKSLFKNIPFAITHQWKGPILEPVDGLPFIGEFRDHQTLYAMAFSGNGMTYSMISAQIFKDHISGYKNQFADLYKADRMPYMRLLMVKGRDYTDELMGGAVKNSLSHNKALRRIKHILE
jgi:glycine/D-amino acid oxidase-like deaminating enzyme